VIIKTLKIGNLRNITQAELSLSSNTNIITGENGAGKTTLLEAIYLLARAKSFRPGPPRSIIQRGKESLLIFSELEDRVSTKHKIGLTRTASTLKIKIDGLPAKKLSDLAIALPIVLITPQSHRLIEEGPEHRRRVFNWGVFHVEHSYKNVMTEFNRTLLQRNNALRSGSGELAIWDRLFIEHGLRVNHFQSTYFDSWKCALQSIIKDVPFLQDLEISMGYGWPNGEDLEDVLLKRKSNDKDKGFTSIGPHRMDIFFRLGGCSTKQSLSRGQQKILVTSIFLAQAKVLSDKIGDNPIFLFDDMESELDNNSIALLSRLIKRQNSQIFLTSIKADKQTSDLWNGLSAMFHVKHGEIIESRD
jgi:DNA replication and repair protein RecF